MEHVETVVIHGIREDGKKFRPSDWIERLSATLASFGADQRLSYAQSAKPCMINGEKCLVVEADLAQTNPEAYDFIIDFARSNQLRIEKDRRKRDVSVTKNRRHY